MRPDQTNDPAEPEGSEPHAEPAASPERSGASVTAESAQPAASPERSGASEHGTRLWRAPTALVTGGLIVLVLVIVVMLVVLKLTTTPHASPLPHPQLAPAAVVQTVEHLPASVFANAGVPGRSLVTPPIRLIHQRPATAGRRALVLYVGAEYCPYCAAMRWPLVIALSRFGTFSDLGLTSSSPQDVFPATPSFTFRGSSYRSRYVWFEPVEQYASQPIATSPSGYAPLQSLSTAQRLMMHRYDNPPFVHGDLAGTIPFVDVANRIAQAGLSFSPGIIAHMSMAQVAKALVDPSSPVSEAIVGDANLITAGICSATGDRPAAVCDSPPVRQAAQAEGID